MFCVELTCADGTVVNRAVRGWEDLRQKMKKFNRSVRIGPPYNCTYSRIVSYRITDRWKTDGLW